MTPTATAPTPAQVPTCGLCGDRIRVFYDRRSLPGLRVVCSNPQCPEAQVTHRGREVHT